MVSVHMRGTEDLRSTLMMYRMTTGMVFLRLWAQHELRLQRWCIIIKFKLSSTAPISPAGQFEILSSCERLWFANNSSSLLYPNEVHWSAMREVLYTMEGVYPWASFVVKSPAGRVVSKKRSESSLRRITHDKRSENEDQNAETDI